MDFRAWLIAQGKAVYLAALKDPDSLADVPVYQNCRFEALLYAGNAAYERLTGRMADDDIDLEAHQQLTAELRRGIVYGAGIEYHMNGMKLPPISRACVPPAQHLKNCGIVPAGDIFGIIVIQTSKRRGRQLRKRKNPGSAKVVTHDERCNYRSE